MTKSRGILRPRRAWTEFELEMLRLHYADTVTADLAELFDRPLGSVHQHAIKLGLRKTPEFVARIARDRVEQNPEHGSRRTRLLPGNVPPNKGVKRPPGWAPGRMASSQFKPGSVPHTWRPVGSVTVNADGYLDRKVNDEPGPRHVRWKPVHRLVWEAANGPVPEGHVVVFRPGQKTTVEAEITLDRVELLTRRQLMQRNTIHNWPEPLKRVMRVRASLTRAINQRDDS